MVNQDLPAQPPHGLALVLYNHLRVVYILGFLECLFGAAVIVIESAGIGFFFDWRINFSLQACGIMVGLLMIITGACDFWAGRDNIAPPTRRKLFFGGIILSLLAAAAVCSMFVFSTMTAYQSYKEVEDRALRGESDTIPRILPYVLSLEGSRHQAQLRAIAAVAYAVCLLLVVGSLYLNCINVRKNKSNAETATVYARVPKEDVRLGSPKRTGKGTDL